jgi:bacterioferritin-associated ferredoxin
VTTQQVQACVLAGAHTVREVGERCGAGTGCGSCVKKLRRLLDQSEPQATAMQRLPNSA